MLPLRIKSQYRSLYLSHITFNNLVLSPRKPHLIFVLTIAALHSTTTSFRLALRLLLFIQGDTPNKTTLSIHLRFHSHPFLPYCNIFPQSPYQLCQRQENILQAFRSPDEAVEALGQQCRDILLLVFSFLPADIVVLLSGFMPKASSVCAKDTRLVTPQAGLEYRGLGGWVV